MIDEPKEEQVQEDIQRDLSINISLLVFNLSLIKKENNENVSFVDS